MIDGSSGSVTSSTSSSDPSKAALMSSFSQLSPGRSTCTVPNR